MVSYSISLGDLIQTACIVLGLAFTTGQIWSWKRETNDRLSSITEDLKSLKGTLTTLEIAIAQHSIRLDYLEDDRTPFRRIKPNEKS